MSELASNDEHDVEGRNGRGAEVGVKLFGFGDDSCLAYLEAVLTQVDRCTTCCRTKHDIS